MPEVDIRKGKYILHIKPPGGKEYLVLFADVSPFNLRLYLSIATDTHYIYTCIKLKESAGNLMVRSQGLGVRISCNIM